MNLAPQPDRPAIAQLGEALAVRRARAMACDSVLDLIGGTPLIRLRHLEPNDRAGRSLCEIWAKCEFANPGGSVKDRPALSMIRAAIADGRLTRDKVLIDSTSGNTGVAYSLVGAALGYRVKLVMPANVSAARKQITAAYGTELVFSSEMEGSDGAIHRVQELVAADPGRYFYPDQYSNEANPGAHYHGTGPEILAALGDRLTHFIAGVGTSGTVMGTGRRLKEHRRPDGGTVTVVALLPDDALHGMEGLKHLESSIVPKIWRPDDCVDRLVHMPTDEAWDVTERLAADEGLFVGHSAGANVAGALRLARELVDSGRTGCIATVLCDRGDRYFVPLKWEKNMSGEAGIPHIDAAVLAQCYAEAAQSYPEEACGLLAGPRDSPVCDEARPCKNMQNELHLRDPESFPRDAATAYNLGFRDLRYLEDSQKGPRPVKIIYHSHCDVGAYFSQEDQRAATFDGELLYPVDYLVIDCRESGVQGAKLFRFQGGSFVEAASYPGPAADPTG